MASSHRICQEMGIQIVAKRNFRAGPLEPRQTRSRDTIKTIAEVGQEIGYPELVYDVLGLFLTSPVNERNLYGEVIHGVAKWVQAANLRTADIPFVRPAFGEVDLGLIRETVMHHRILNRPPQIALLVAGMMDPALAAIDLNRRQRA